MNMKPEADVSAMPEMSKEGAVPAEQPVRVLSQEELAAIAGGPSVGNNVP